MTLENTELSNELNAEILETPEQVTNQELNKDFVYLRKPLCVVYV